MRLEDLEGLRLVERDARRTKRRSITRWSQCGPHTDTEAHSNKLRGEASRVRGSVAKVSDWG